MEKLLSAAMTLGLMLMVVVVYADPEQAGIVDRLLEQTTTARGEDMVTGAAIAPRNGWIADYHPVIIAQVLREPPRTPQVLKEPTRQSPPRESKPVPPKRPNKLLRRLKLFLKKFYNAYSAKEPFLGAYFSFATHLPYFETMARNTASGRTKGT